MKFFNNYKIKHISDTEYNAVKSEYNEPLLFILIQHNYNVVSYTMKYNPSDKIFLNEFDCISDVCGDNPLLILSDNEDPIPLAKTDHHFSHLPARLNLIYITGVESMKVYKCDMGAHMQIIKLSRFINYEYNTHIYEGFMTKFE